MSQTLAAQVLPCSMHSLCSGVAAPWVLSSELSGTCGIYAGALGLTADGHVVERWFFWVVGPGAGNQEGGAAELAERLRMALAASHPLRSDPRDALRQAISSANPSHDGVPPAMIRVQLQHILGCLHSHTALNSARKKDQSAPEV